MEISEGALRWVYETKRSVLGSKNSICHYGTMRDRVRRETPPSLFHRGLKHLRVVLLHSSLCRSSAIRTPPHALSTTAYPSAPKDYSESLLKATSHSRVRWYSIRSAAVGGIFALSKMIATADHNTPPPCASSAARGLHLKSPDVVDEGQVLGIRPLDRSR